MRATLRHARANGISLKDQILFARLAAKSGMNIIAVPSLEGDKAAWYDGRSNVYLDASAPRTRSFSALLGHEMWHKMFKAKNVKGLFMQAWNNIDKTKRDQTIKAYMKAEQEKGRTPRESAKISAEEVAAAYAEELFNFPHVWDFVLDGEPTLKERVIAFFKGAPKRYSFAPEMDPAARAWLREYKKIFDEVSRLNAGNSAAEMLGNVVEKRDGTATKVPEKVVKRIGKIVDNAQKTPLTNINQEDMDVSGERSAIQGYDYKKPFYQQIEDYKKGVFPKTDSLILGQTPEAFLNIGLNPLPMTINQRHVDYVINGTKNADHEIGEVVLKYLPTALKNPVAIISSATANSTSLVAIISITHNGHQIIAPIYIDGAAQHNGIEIDSNAITSVHSRKNAISKLLAGAVLDEANGKIGVYYWDKKRALALLSGEKVTMPNILNTLSDGSIHSILEKGSPVKPKIKNITESQQFIRWFGDWQNHPDKASKVVNQDGTPKVVYHGSKAEFTVFKESTDGALGKGIYFAESKEYAKGVGPTVYEVYLDIKKPYIARVPGGIDTAKLQSQGYDGVYAPGPGFWVAFEPEQIKSATDNIGTFSKFDPDIRYALKTDPEYKAKVDAKAEAKVEKAKANAEARADAKIEKAKARAEAKAEARVEKAKANAEARADKRIETEGARMHAEYKTDAVFSQ